MNITKEILKISIDDYVESINEINKIEPFMMNNPLLYVMDVPAGLCYYFRNRHNIKHAVTQKALSSYLGESAILDRYPISALDKNECIRRLQVRLDVLHKLLKKHK